MSNELFSIHPFSMETLLVREPLNTTPKASVDVKTRSQTPGWDEGT